MYSSIVSPLGPRQMGQKVMAFVQEVQMHKCRHGKMTTHLALSIHTTQSLSFVSVAVAVSVLSVLVVGGGKGLESVLLVVGGGKGGADGAGAGGLVDGGKGLVYNVSRQAG